MIRLKSVALLAIVGVIAGCHETISQTPTHAHTLTDPQVTARAADALRAADLVTQDIPQTLAGIDLAIRIVQFNLQHAEDTGFKGTQTRVIEGKPSILELDTEQGAIEKTGRHLDVAISGDGFFGLKSRGCEVYTRNGNFFVNQEGKLVSSSGHLLRPGIEIPHGATGPWISEDGDVICIKPGSTLKSAVGRIQIYRFRNPAGLALNDEGLFIQTDASGIPIEASRDDSHTGALLQDFLEASNVNVYQQRLRLKLLETWRREILRAMPH